MKKRSKITHVAVRFRGVTYSLPAPNRHHHVLWHIAEVTGAKHIDSHGDDQGFLDEDKNYLNRKEALISALENNQVKDPSKIRAGRLFSEDVW